MAALLVRTPAGATSTVALTTLPITVGRADGCDVRLPDDEVSRIHAEVWLDEDGQVLVADRGSKNGTRVDGGEPFRDATRVAQRLIRIGDFELEIVGVPSHTPPPGRVRFQPDPPTQIGDTHYFPSSRRLDLNLQRLNLLMSLAERIGGAFERKQLLEQALDACCESLGFERGLIAIKSPRGETELPVTRNIPRDPSGAYMISRTLINRALLHGERAVVNNPATDLVQNLSESLLRYPICSALCVPILHRDEILGVIYGDRVTRASTYTPEDVDFLAAIARQVGVGLANLRLFAEYVRSQKVYLELEQARRIQQQLLPAAPLVAGRIALAGHNEPSSAVSGDYYDYFPLTGDRVAFIIADVTGHGLSAALIMANLQAAVRVALTADLPLPELAARLNELICTNTDTHVFITGILGRANTRTGVLEYVTAGHPAPLLVRAGGLVEPGTDGRSLPFGVEPDEEYHVQCIEPDETLVAALFYTDGLVEAENREGKLLETGPVMAALAANAADSTESVIRATLGAVQAHLGDGKPADDLTLLALQFVR